ncbi:MAG: glycosyltransferase family 4 protein [Bacteroidetes bacterium]|nr:glycosyltransferase family 4 protein [Bacteroidota bacterium]
MRIAMLAPIAWRTPPRHYGPWERVTSLLTEALVARGIDVTLFATADSRTNGHLRAVAPAGYEEDRSLPAKVWECLHISEVFEHAGDFDLIHNQFDFLPLAWSHLVATPVLTTIHGFSSPDILPVYRKYNGTTYYVAISDADRDPDLDYVATIHHGIDVENFRFVPQPDADGHLLFFGRIHPDKGTHRAIEIARACNRKLVIAGIVQDETYFHDMVKPHIDEKKVQFVGSAGPGVRNALLGGAAALLHPISFSEPFGLSIVEAMACGTPAIAFNRGSMPELIDSGRTGFLVSDVEEAAEAVRKIETIDRRTCREEVRKRFSVERMAGDYIAAYEWILTTHNPRATMHPAGDHRTRLLMEGSW